MGNRDVQMTLEQAVGEVLNSLTGLDLHYQADADRFQSITKTLNRALRAVALEREWSYYSSTEEIGVAHLGVQTVEIGVSQRLRIINDDAVRLVDSDGQTRVWAYILPRDAIHKYGDRNGLWCAVTRSTITFSRPFSEGESGLRVIVPVMREPVMFRLPRGSSAASSRVLNQLVDFDYPDLIVAKAAQLVASSDPVMQPRVQTLEAQYKDIMYQLIERDERMTDSPFSNTFNVPIIGSLHGSHSGGSMTHLHPHSDER